MPGSSATLDARNQLAGADRIAVQTALSFLGQVGRALVCAVLASGPRPPPGLRVCFRMSSYAVHFDGLGRGAPGPAAKRILNSHPWPVTAAASLEAVVYPSPDAMSALQAAYDDHIAAREHSPSWPADQWLQTVWYAF